jgi:hypothetical protein
MQRKTLVLPFIVLVATVILSLAAAGQQQGGTARRMRGSSKPATVKAVPNAPVVIPKPAAAVALKLEGTEAASAAGIPDLSTILMWMEQAQRENGDQTRPYTVVREYSVFGSETGKANSQVMAQVTFLPPDRKSFSIVKSGGSGRGAGVVTKLLENEVELARRPERKEISPRNYRFTYVGERALDGRKCYELGVEPLRKETYLLKGNACVDAETYRVLRFEGEPARSPSWWLKKTHMEMRYGNRDGLWVPVATEAVAEVRMFGRHTMTSREVSFESGQAMAAEAASVPISAPKRVASNGKTAEGTALAQTRGIRRGLRPVLALPAVAVPETAH